MSYQNNNSHGAGGSSWGGPNGANVKEFTNAAGADQSSHASEQKILSRQVGVAPLSSSAARKVDPKRRNLNKLRHQKSWKTNLALKVSRIFKCF